MQCQLWGINYPRRQNTAADAASTDIAPGMGPIEALIAPQRPANGMPAPARPPDATACYLNRVFRSRSRGSGGTGPAPPFALPRPQAGRSDSRPMRRNQISSGTVTSGGTAATSATSIAHSGQRSLPHAYSVTAT